MTTDPATPPSHPTTAATTHTVESLVRQQLGQALGGRRGMVEAAVPTLAFTALWLTTRNLTARPRHERRAWRSPSSWSGWSSGRR